MQNYTYTNKIRWFGNFKSYWLVFFILIIVLCSGCSHVIQPYSGKFRCPPGHNGLCESLEDAYVDSVYGIDPALFDEKWIAKKKKWEQKNKKLVEIRKKLNTGYKTIDEKIKELEERAQYDPKKDIAAYTYKQYLFNDLKNLLAEPEAPLVIPPKVVRVLVLSTLSPDDGEKTLYVSPHYVYIMLDKPRWLLHPIKEQKSPFDVDVNPILLR